MIDRLRVSTGDTVSIRSGRVRSSRWIEIEKRVEPGTIERGLVQLLRGTHERTGLFADRIDDRVIPATRLGREEQDQLARAGRHGEVERVLLALPRLGLREPGFRGRIGRAAQKRGDEHIVHALIARQFGADRDPVSLAQIGNLPDRQRRPAMGHGDAQRRAGKVERGGIRMRLGQREQRSQQQRMPQTEERRTDRGSQNSHRRASWRYGMAFLGRPVVRMR
ncbi:hypothetical protein [Sphingomonas sp. 22R3R2A-7]|uniref:hypothetical protein n=1 Tax=Sphingomonas sp. 22R3R2A-7 TaxID=3050230 RepID=UPI002FE1C9A6